MNYTFRYVVTGYDDYVDRPFTDRGFVYGESSADATAKVVDFFGEESITLISLIFHGQDEGLIVDDTSITVNKNDIDRHIAKLVEVTGGATNG